MAYIVLVCLLVPLITATRGAVTWEDARTRARAILNNYPLVDGHNDLPWQYRERVDNHVEMIDLTQNVDDQWGPSHTDIPRLRQGQVGSLFWAAFIGCSKQFNDAVRASLEQVDVVYRMMEKYPQDFQMVTTAQGIEDAFVAGKIGGLIGLEGGHSIDSSAGSLRMYYALGVRYVTLTHNCNTPWADANNEEENSGGLSDWGKRLVEEMNLLGMLVDISHVKESTMDDVLDVSRAPVIFSHSNAYELCNHERNVPDDVLRKLESNNGIVMVTFVPGFLNCAPSDGKTADIALVADHIEHIRDLIGDEHVGIGSDFDGTESVPEGLEDTSKFPDLFAELIMRGWSDESLENLAGRNLVRVFRDVEQVANQLKLEGERPMSVLIPEGDLLGESCRTDF